MQAGGTARLTSTIRNAAGQVITGQPVTWTSSDPTVAAVSVDGSLTSLGRVGTTSVSASIGNIQSNSILFTVTPAAPATLSKIGSYPGTLPAGAALTDSIRVQITDTFGNGVSGITITFATMVGGGSVSPTTVTSDAAGRAAARYSTGAVPGINTATATVSGLTPASFSVNTVAGAPSSLTKIGTDPAIVPAGGTLNDSIRVVVRDGLGNGISGVQVVFAVTAGGGSISPSTVTSDVAGRAAARFTTGVVGGINTSTATVSGLPQVTFTVTAMPAGNQRAFSERADLAGGNQVHVMYVLPSDGIDRALDTNGTLENSVGSFQNWLSGQTGGRRLRIDTYQGGAIDVTFFRIPRTNAQMMSYGVFIRDTIEREMAIAGFNVTTKIYAVYYDGGTSVACGGGAWPPVLRGVVGALYLQGAVPGFAPCNSTPFAASPTDAPRYLEFVMLHELLHTLGFVASNAPNHTLAGHAADDSRDLMYAGTLPWIPSILDVGKNDYFGSNVPPGVLNLANSGFLTP